MRLVHYFIRVSEGHGGVSRAIFDLVSLLVAAGHDVTLLTAADSEVPREWKTSERRAPDVVLLEPPSRPFELLSGPSLTRAEKVLHNADVLHLHGIWRPASSQLAALARRMGKPYVMTIHGMLDDWCMQQRPWQKRVYHCLLERRNLAAARRVHLTARAEADQVRKWIPHDRLSVIPYALDLEPFTGSPGPDLFLSTRPTVDVSRASVLFLSRLHPKKGPEILIEAIGRLRRDGVCCQLLLAGPGKPAYIRDLRKLAAKHAPDTHFLGLVTGAEKLSLYGFADLLALPTHQENFGLVIPEALACGTPVITTRGTDIWPELEASRAALIVDSTPDSFAAAIGDLLADEERRSQMGRDGRLWVFDWLDRWKVVDRYERFYRGALAAWPGGSDPSG